ncbi:fimbrial biogenesis outer membrane usher protein [Escherichia coli]|nr:fimbrial biogenesis outer membrane usher protein [Escherichia coli]HAV8511570.1 fimbrial biogenesis outer membrane usher protein [Escherichia coli]
MKRRYLYPALSPTLIALVSSGTFPAFAKDYFDPGLLSLGGGQESVADLSVFETSGKVPAGTYLVNVFFNQNDQGQYTIDFKENSKGYIYPQMTPDFLQEMGVNIAALPAFKELAKDKPVADLASLIPDARVHFNFAEQRLDISVPQIAMSAKSRGYVDSKLWDDGIPALLMNYSVSGNHNWQSAQKNISGGEQTNLFANLRGGLNWDAWRLRSNATWTWNENQITHNAKHESNISFNSTYLQRDIREWHSEILAGENTTFNDVFDSIPFKGIQLNSSEDMLPYSQRGFAPVITGIAQSNARVTISQNGNVVYQTYVPPGPFKIDDLYQSGLGGDLTITITEANGSVRTRTIAYSTLPVMQRPGGIKYELTGGKYNGGITQTSQEAEFALGTLLYGLPHDVTLYGGVLFAEEYASLVSGIGVSLNSFGAVSADVTTSNAKLKGLNDRQEGNSYRIRYAKNIIETGTSFDLAAYRYSTKHYYSFADFNNIGYLLNEDQAPWALSRQRSNFQVRLSQQLGIYGSLYLSGSRSDFWGYDQVNTTLSAGYNGNYNSINYNLAYSIDRIKGDGDWPENRQFSFSMQVPFSLFTQAVATSRSYASYQMTYNNSGQVTQQTGVNGTTLDDRLSYNVMQGWSNSQNISNASSMNLGYQGSKGSANLGYSYSQQNRSLNMSGNGGVVVHSKGVTFSQILGSSVALVAAPGSIGTHIMNGNIQTDSQGYAVVPYLSGYQKNTINLDPTTLPDDVDVTQSSILVYPTKGAVVTANFATRIGLQALLTLTQNGQPLPFGALVTIEDENKQINSGIIGDAGQVYLSGLPENGQLNVKWGTTASQQCRANYNLRGVHASSENNPVRMLRIKCN